MSKLDDIFSDEFDAAVKTAIAQGVAETLKAGVPIFYWNEEGGFYVKELPDGRKFEIRLIPGAPGDSNYEVLRELPSNPRKTPAEAA